MASFETFPSSSSFVTAKGWKYDVFLSFRGEDTRYEFVDDLYTGLVQRGLWVFKDDEALRRGEEISPQLLKAIEESRFALVVFSKNYADSSWCLAELAKIIEAYKRMELKVLPVFYYVDPSDVRHQKKEFAVAFKKHEKKFRENMDKVNEWRKALTSAANFAGFHISERIKQGEPTIINEIVHDIMGHIPRDLDNNLIGMEPHLRELISLLGIDEAIGEVRMVGIHGMGGIGKTTIARALFSRIAHMFEGSSIVYDVRENSSTNGSICALQEKALKEILVTNYKFRFQHPKDGANMIRTKICRKRVLLVLDDVDSHKQLEFLAHSCEWFGPGSRILITTRDEQLLSKVFKKYKPNLLQEDQALELFSRHAFEKIPKEGYEELSRQAIRYAGHLPLAVKVLGSFFSGLDNAGEWESALNRLAKEPNEDIFEILKLSFDGLTDSEKKIFLDIACFFKGKHADHVKRILDSFSFDPVIGISVLIKKSLITVSDGCINMHDLIQEMGWQIVRKCFPNSRIWELEKIHDIIKRNEKLEAIEAIMMPDNQYDVDEYGEENVDFSVDIFESMKNLRLLDINGKFTSHEPTFLPYGLRWLRWKRYPFSSLPVAGMHKLVGLEVLGGTVSHFWNGQQIMRCLKFMALKELVCLTRFPDVSMAPNINTMDLSFCKNLVEVHESLVCHKRLARLVMDGCKRLKHLPSKIEMESLEFLSLYKCYSLERFPGVLRAPNIKYLSLDNCKNLVEIHESLGSHKRLVELKMDGCERLKHLPSMIEMESLESLSLANYQSLEISPDVSGAPNIKMLSLTDCKNLIEVHESIVSHKRLVELDMRGCKRLENLPSKIEMESLKDLSLGECYSLERLPDVSGSPNINRMDLSYCKKLVEIHESLGSLTRLVKLDMRGCERLKHLPSRIEMKSLEDLSLEECFSLERLPNVFGSPNINRMGLSYCKNLIEVHESLGSHKRLVKLHMRGCERLKHLPNKIDMESLEDLCLGECYSLENLPDVSGAPNIKVMDLSYCRNLVEVHESLGYHKRLVELEMRGCERLKYLPSKIEMESLEYLSLGECYNLERLPDVSRAPSIKSMDLSYCKNLVEVHESILSHKSIVELDMRGCERLKHLPSKIEMESLEYLSLGECYNLERLPDVSGAPNIKKMDLSYCKNLVEVHESLVSHKGLVELHMRGCERLKHLPSKIEMESLEDLYLDGCYSLESFPNVSLCRKVSNISLGCGFNMYNLLVHRFRYWELKNIENNLCRNKKLHKLPENLESMENMEIPRLGLEDDDFVAFERVLGFNSLHILSNLCSLTELDLKGRQMEDKDFPKDLHSLSSLEYLNLSGNYKLIQLPAGKHLPSF